MAHYLAERLRLWTLPLCNPLQVGRGLVRYPRFFRELSRYRRLPGAEPIRLADLYPQLHDRTTETRFDSHYFYANGWAMRRIIATKPQQHVDIGSQVIFPNLLAGLVPVLFLDYRPLIAPISGMRCVCADILRLPIADGDLQSVSCLHVAEHIGLGRYGDTPDPTGTAKAARELGRILAPRGNLFFAVPVGVERCCFNAHRIHHPRTILEYFDDLALMELSGVRDDGTFVERVELSEFEKSDYACGMYWFQRRG